MMTETGKLHWVGKRENRGKDPNKPFYVRKFVLEKEKLEKIVFELKQEGTDIIEERHVGQQVEVTYRYDTREWQGQWFMALLASDVAFINKSTGEVEGKDIPANILSDGTKVDDDFPF